MQIRFEYRMRHVIALLILIPAIPFALLSAGFWYAGAAMEWVATKLQKAANSLTWKYEEERYQKWKKRMRASGEIV